MNIANDDNDNVSEEGSGSEAELEVWQEVHSSLLIAIRMAQAGISQSKAQRRFWLEEIEANLNEDGTLKSESIWRRPVPLIRHTAKVTSSKGGGTGKSGKSLKRKKNKDVLAEKPSKKPRKKKSVTASEPEVTKKKKPPSPAKKIKKKQVHNKSRTTISVGKQLLPAVAAAARPACPDDDDVDEYDEKMDQKEHGSSNNSDDEGPNEGGDHDRDFDDDEDDVSAVDGPEEDDEREISEHERSYTTSPWAEVQYQQRPARLAPQQQHQPPPHHHHQHHLMHHHTQQQQHPSTWGVVHPQTQSQSAAQSLQLMAAVAFGAVGRPPSQHQHHVQADHHEAFHQHNRHHHHSTPAHHLPTSHHLAAAAAASQGFGWPNSQPQPPHYLNHPAHLQQQAQPAYAVPQPPRNYASLNDIASDEEEEDRF